MFEALNYSTREAAASLWHRRRSGAVAIVTIASALVVLGGFLLITVNLEVLLSRWNAAAELSVYLKDEITAAQRGELDRLIEASDIIEARENVTKLEALSRFRREFGDLGVLGGENPFPASIEVRIKPGHAEPLTQLIGQLKQTPGVADIQYDRQWLDRLAFVVTLLRSVGLAMSLVLVLAAALTVANVVRLASLARREEIEIMHLVGAPMMYVRGPFVVEGFLQGGLGAIVAMLSLWSGFVLLRSQYNIGSDNLLWPEAIAFLPLQVCVWLLIGGIALGGLGGAVAARGVK